MRGSKGRLLAGMVLPAWYSTVRAEEQPLPNDGARVARASRFVAEAASRGKKRSDNQLISKR